MNTTTGNRSIFLVKTALVSISALFVNLHVCGQTGSQNYVMSVSYADSLRNNSVTQVCYFDGLGNRTMTVANTGGQDGYVGSYQEYDLLGRESRAWLPVPASSQLDFADIDEFRQAAVDYYSDSRPYSESHYDALGRVTKVDGEGMAWKTAGRSSVMRYGSNSGGEVMLFEASHGGVFLRGYYAAGELTSHISIDEDGRVVKVFKDIRDRTVMERRATDNDTYYVYDTKGNLSYVLPPELSRVMTQVSGVWTSVDNSLKSLAFIYEYDEYGRCVRKKLPGCGYVETGYDNDSRVAIVSDGNMRQSGRCRFFLYDKAGRTVVQGTCACPSGQTSSMSFVATYTGNGEYGGYSFNGNLADVALLQVDYYDGYSFLDYYGDSIKAEIDFSPQEGFDNPKSFTRGMHTGAAVYMIGDNPARSISVSYYDHKGREICTKRTNHIGGKEQYWRRYTFTGNVETVLHIHSAKGRNTRTERMCYEYDTSGRMLKATHTLDGGTPTVIADCVYDSVGRLHANMRNGNGSLTTTYGYNLRSWVTAISGPLFSESIGYNESNGNTPQWGGNISTVTWQCDSVLRGYNYRYDSMSRLTDALYVESGVPSPKYDTSYTYDANGNLLNLQRHGMLDDLSYGLVDNLDYVYDGNQLVSVSDTETGPNYKGAFHFADRSSAATEYEYDENGNMTKDLNKKITSIQYNLLNLPSKVDFESGNYMEYKYDAKGNKLMSVHMSIPFLDVSPGIVKGGKWEGGLENTPRRLSGRPKPGIFPSDSLYLDEKQFVSGYTQYEYCDNLIYENEKLSQVLFDGGYISIDGRTGMSKYHFYLRDHLGSNRVVADAAGTVEQVSHYYPYGGLMADISTNQDMQRFRFQGKELDRFGNIDWNDHGARHADLQIGRWNTVDPLCEAYYDSSPYTYCGNSPSSMVDNDGCDYWATNDYEQIRTFINAVGGGQSQFDFSGWNHSTDAEFCANLTYNDETHKFYTSYAKVIDGELTVVGKSFDANLTPVSFSGLGYKGAFVYEPTTSSWKKFILSLDGGLKYNDGYYNWKVDYSGRITGYAPNIGIVDFGGSFSKTGGIAKLISKGAKRVKSLGFSHGQKVYKLGNKYYSWDIDKHNGGELKVFERKGGKLKRIGTADENLNIYKK